MPSLLATSKNRPVEKPMNGMSGFTRIQNRRPCSASSSVSGGGTQMFSSPKYSYAPDSMIPPPYRYAGWAWVAIIPGR